MKINGIPSCCGKGFDLAQRIQKALTKSAVAGWVNAFFVSAFPIFKIQQIFISFHHLNFQTMNGTFAKRGFQAVLTMFFVFGGLALANRAEAQKVVVTNLQSVQQQQQWLTEQEALSVLETEMFDLKTQLNSLTPGTSAYNNILIHLDYFMGIYQAIQGGQTVPEAVAGSLGTLDSSASPYANAPQVPRSTQQALYDEAVTLLTK